MDGAVASIHGPFSYDPSGNITAIGSTPGSYYVYDPMSRVVVAGVQQGAAVQTQSYAYDVYGNRLGVGGTGGGTYTVDAETNHLTSQGAQYDSAGNLTRWYPPGSSYAREYSYDAGGMLTQELAPAGSYPAWSTLHLYTAGDERYWTYATRATYADVVSHYTIRDLGGNILRDYVQDANGFSVANDYVYRDGLLLASIKTSATHHYSLDHLGTPRIVTDQGGYKLAEHTYYPFGLELTDGSPTDGLLKFTGHERNPDVLSQANGQLDYMHARHYGANLGRFLTVDPVLQVMRAMKQPQIWNRYSYGANNPLKYIDPTGKVLELPSDCNDKKTTCKELATLRNTVPVELRMFVRARTVDGKTILDDRYLNMQRDASSENFQSLRQIANSPGTATFNASMTNVESKLGSEAVGRNQPTEGVTYTSSQSLSGKIEVYTGGDFAAAETAEITAHELRHARRLLLGLPAQHEPMYTFEDNTLTISHDPNGPVNIETTAAEREATGNYDPFVPPNE